MLHARADALNRELRVEHRRARVDVVDRAADPLDAIRGQAVLERLRSVEDACARVLSAVLTLSAEHR
jgi:hypothetical protein